MKTRVAVCVPSHDLLHADFAMSLTALAVQASNNVDIALINGKSSIVAIARNNCVDGALQAGADWVFFLDSDMTFPPDTLQRLLAHRKDIVGATYARRNPPHETLAKAVDPNLKQVTGMFEAEIMPTGCLLINAGIFAKLPKPWFYGDVDWQNGIVIGEDILFCRRARNLGYRIWCDVPLSFQLGHLGQHVVRVDGAVSTGSPIEQQMTSAA